MSRLEAHSAHNPTLPTKLISGVTPSQHSIDWLTYTVPADTPLDQAILPHPALRITGYHMRRARGYDTTLALTSGKISYHTRRPQQKICVEFTGRDLDKLRAAGVNVQDIVAYALTLKASITRLDFALDIFTPVDHMDLHTAWLNHTLRCPSRTCEFFRKNRRLKGNIERSDTLYLGSTASQRRLRCYNKAAQLKLSTPWTRLELVVRGDIAGRLAQAMIEYGIGAAGRQAMRDYIQCEIEWVNEALQGESVYIEPGSRRDTHTTDWLIHTVLPVLEKTMQDGDPQEAMQLKRAYLDALLQIPSNPGCNIVAAVTSHEPS